MKKITTLILTGILLLALLVPAFAANHSFVVDSTGVLSDPTPLNEQAEALYEKYGVSICFLTATIQTAEACTNIVNQIFVPGESIPDAPAIVFVDGGDKLYVRGLNSPEPYFREGVTDGLFDAYETETNYTDGVEAYLYAAETYLVDYVPADPTDPDKSTDEGVTTVSETVGDLERFVDGAGLVTDPSAAGALSARLDEISQAQACDVVIVTTDSLGDKTPTAFADDYFDYNGYGVGEDRSGILFLISMEDRDWAISTRGYGITAFTDYGQEQIMNAIRSDLGNDDFLSAFNGFADKCDELLTMAREGRPLDIEEGENRLRSIVFGPVGAVIALVLGFLFSGIPMKKLKNEINNVKWKNTASDYTRPGSVQLTQSYENFLYANTSRTVIETETRSSSGGGSSTHTSSSGATHGGSSGKF